MYQDGCSGEMSLKSLFALFYSLSRLFQLAVLVKMLANSPEVEAVQ